MKEATLDNPSPKVNTRGSSKSKLETFDNSEVLNEIENLKA